MTREEVAAKIHWPFIVWASGFANVIAMMPQPIQLLRTRSTDGVAVEMFMLFFVIQIVFALEGYFKRSKVLVVCMALSAILSAATIALVFYYRHSPS